MLDVVTWKGQFGSELSRAAFVAPVSSSAHVATGVGYLSGQTKQKPVFAF